MYSVSHSKIFDPILTLNQSIFQANIFRGSIEKFMATRLLGQLIFTLSHHFIYLKGKYNISILKLTLISTQ